jgi:hypothetical protein
LLERVGDLLGDLLLDLRVLEGDVRDDNAPDTFRTRIPGITCILNKQHPDALFVNKFFADLCDVDVENHVSGDIVLGDFT